MPFSIASTETARDAQAEGKASARGRQEFFAAPGAENAAAEAGYIWRGPAGLIKIAVLSPGRASRMITAAISPSEITHST
jgi:hypothetical protein